MKTLIANLKIYLPNRYFWPAYLYSALIIFFTVGFVADQKNDEQLVTGVFMNLPIFAGFLASLMHIDIFSKPFSFCLPGHRQNVKKVLLILCVIASLFLGLIAAVFVFGDRWSGVVIPIFFANIIFFLLGAELILITGNVLIFIWVIMFMPSFYSRPYDFLGWLILQHPVILISAGLLSCIFIWRKLNFSEIHRKLCAVPQMPIIGMWNKERLEKYNQFKLASQKGKIRFQIKPSVERFFLKKMNKYKYFGMGRYIWGNLYKTYGPQFSNFNPLGVLFLLAMLFAFCYSRQSSPFALFMMVLMVTVFTQIPVFSTMLISDGRKERFYSALGLSITYTFYIMCICAVVIVLTNIAKPIMPDFILFDKAVSFHPISFSFILLPVLAVPFIFTFRLIFYKKHLLLFLMVIILYSIMIALFLSFQNFADAGVHEFSSVIINPYSVVSSIVLLWAIFLAVLRRACFKWSLV